MAMASTKTVDILMATYNGAAYLGEQLDSIIAQTYSDWQLFISDDGSSDATVEVIQKYAARDARIHLVDDHGVCGSAKDNFFSLIDRSDADRSFLADQDDVWLPHKIEDELRAMDRLDHENSDDLPLLVFSDMVVVDEQLNVIADSFLVDSGKGRCTVDLANLLTTNIVAGCTSCMNRALRQLIADAPKAGAIIHDWWIALVAASCGKIAMLPEPTVLYRQHGGNVVGAESYSMLDRLAHFSESTTKYWDSCSQAVALAKAFGDAMDDRSRAIVRAHASEPNGGRMSALRNMHRRGLFKPDPIKAIGQVITVAFFAGKSRA